MNARKFFIVSTIIILIASSIVFAHVYTSQNYTLRDARIVISGGKAHSTNYSLDNVEIGNVFGGKAESAHFSLDGNLSLIRDSSFLLIKLTSDVYEDETNIIAGSQVSLTVRLKINGIPAPNQLVRFCIIQGNGSIAQSVVRTNLNGEATGILITDTDASVTNLVEVFHENFPDKKATFHIDTKAGPPAIIVKLTDDSIHFTPGSSIYLVVRLKDSNNNPVPNEVVTYQIIIGPGSLSSTAGITDEYGCATVTLITTPSPNTRCTIEAQSTSNPGLTVIFNIMTVTVDDVIAKVIANDQLIQDAMADVTVTSNAPWAPPVAKLKMWEKGNKQKVQEISPEPGVHIRPPADTGPMINMTRAIISYNSETIIFGIKSVKEGQTEQYPYQIDYIYYENGVVIRSERYVKDGDYIAHFVTNYSNFININGIWGFQTMTETAYDVEGKQLYTTTYSYSNIQLNTGIPDSVF